MEIKEANHKEEPDLREGFKNSCFKNLSSLLQTSKKYCSKDRKKNSRGIFRIMSDCYSRAFLQK